MKNSGKSEKELLRQQLELLAKRSFGTREIYLGEISRAMCDIYDRLKRKIPVLRIVLLLAVGADLIVSVLILVKYFLRG